MNNDTSQETVSMNLRDYFAAAAMQGLLSSIALVVNDDDCTEDDIVKLLRQIPLSAYEVADDMLAARAKNNDTAQPTV